MTGGLADGARGGPAQAESASTGECWAIVLAAGGGTRFGGPKQFADLAGRPMLEHTVHSASTACDGMVVVLPAAHLERWTAPAGVVVVNGGATRSRCARGWPRCPRGWLSLSWRTPRIHSPLRPSIVGWSTRFSRAPTPLFPAFCSPRSSRRSPPPRRRRWARLSKRAARCCEKLTASFRCRMPSQPAGCATPMPTPPRR